LGGLANVGAVAVLYGTAAGLQADAPDDQLWSQDSTGVQDSNEAQDILGTALGAGDFNGDGFSDLAMGAPGEDVGTVADAGATNVLYGSATGLQADAPDDQLWSQDSTGVQDACEPEDLFGFTLGAGDYDGDGLADLVAGVYLEDVGTVVDAGSASVMYGSTAGLQADAPDDQFWNQDSPGVEDSAEASDQFGWALA
jgi:hypothetical protein